jgi:hypothetical protein
LRHDSVSFCHDAQVVVCRRFLYFHGGAGWESWSME